jgi:pyruvate, orthophosphate dikinase
MEKWVYTFGCESSPCAVQSIDPNLLGGKGASVVEMSRLGIPVPPGLIITTHVCDFFSKNSVYPENVKDDVLKALGHLEQATHKKFGDVKNPLLVSVRSGAPVSMPGMMDTILNLGLNDQTVQGVIEQTQNERFAYDSYRRFIQMYGSVVLGLGSYQFERILDDYKQDQSYQSDLDLTADDLKEICTLYRAEIKQKTKFDFPQNVHEQLWGAVGAVFKSWMNQRAITYRKINNIPENLGTAVTVQSMVFGNMGDDSATGVAFTRNPSTGENLFFGEYLINAQGEDVVSGIRTPQNITIKGKMEDNSNLPALEEKMSRLYQELEGVRQKLEHYFKEMQDLEFTIERGKLWLLQARTGKRSGRAAIKIAVDMVDEGILTKEEAILRVEPQALDQLLHPILDPKAKKDILTIGLPASPGAISGKVVFDADTALKRGLMGESLILVRPETSPEDIHGMHAAKGILTSRGGMTSHAAVVARGMGRTCVVGATKIHIDLNKRHFYVGERIVKENEEITLVGDTGEVLYGAVATTQSHFSEEMNRLMEWVDKIRHLKVRANAETKIDALKAREFGAEGIGLCRTEHMFFNELRILTVRRMILAPDNEARKKALDELLPMQREDFIDIFKVMEGLPITVRLLDPPLHEFLPKTEKELQDLANILLLPLEKVEAMRDQMHEVNPMLGLRGCRLGISEPLIYEMQVRALLEAAVEVQNESVAVDLEIMIPLVSTAEEAQIMYDLVVSVGQKVQQEKRTKVAFKIGTMIELPRAALRANELAQSMEFFSFGTNDLTQTTYGLSRDDSVHFLKTYEEKNIFKKDPFITVDQSGVGELMTIALARGKSVRKDLKTGICGEHGGDPESVMFFHDIGLDYVSCSPYRIPIARLAAAHAVLRKKRS